MRHIHESGDVIYVFSTPLAVRIYYVHKDGHLEELTESVANAHRDQSPPDETEAEQ